MSGADGDKDAGLADFEAAEAMNDCETVDGELLMDARSDFMELGEGHGFVRFVFEIESTAIFGVVADEAVKSDDGAVIGCSNMVGQQAGIDGDADELDNVIVCGGAGLVVSGGHERFSRR